MLDVGELPKMWNLIEFTDFNLECEEKEEDDYNSKSSKGDFLTLNQNSTLPESGDDVDNSEYHPLKPRKGWVA